MTDDGWRPGAPGFPERRDEMEELANRRKERISMAREICLHRGENPDAIDRGGNAGWEKYEPLAGAAIREAERLFALRAPAATARTSDILPLAEAGKRHAEGLSAQLDKPHWEPRRSHIEQARNSIKKLSDAILGLPPSPCFDNTAEHDWEQKVNYSIKHHAFVELYKLCRTLGNFKTGVEHNGIDEGEVYASGVFDRVEAALRIPYAETVSCADHRAPVRPDTSWADTGLSEGSPHPQEGK